MVLQTLFVCARLRLLDHVINDRRFLLGLLPTCSASESKYCILLLASNLTYVTSKEILSKLYYAQNE